MMPPLLLVVVLDRLGLPPGGGVDRAGADVGVELDGAAERPAGDLDLPVVDRGTAIAGAVDPGRREGVGATAVVGAGLHEAVGLQVVVLDADPQGQPGELGGERVWQVVQLDADAVLVAVDRLVIALRVEGALAVGRALPLLVELQQVLDERGLGIFAGEQVNSHLYHFLTLL